MQTNLAIEQNKTLTGARLCGVGLVGEEKSMEERICQRAKS